MARGGPSVAGAQHRHRPHRTGQAGRGLSRRRLGGHRLLGRRLLRQAAQGLSAIGASPWACVPGAHSARSPRRSAPTCRLSTRPGEKAEAQQNAQPGRQPRKWARTDEAEQPKGRGRGGKGKGKAKGGKFKAGDRRGKAARKPRTIGATGPGTRQGSGKQQWSWRNAKKARQRHAGHPTARPRGREARLVLLTAFDGGLALAWEIDPDCLKVTAAKLSGCNKGALPGLLPDWPRNVC